MKICLECAEGGHLNEMLNILDAFEGHDFFFVTTKAAPTKNLCKIAKVYYVRNEHRTRSRNRMIKQINVLVRESLYIVKLLLPCAKILLQEKPRIIVSIGGGATIPLCYIGKILGVKIIYISSLARVHELPFTGKIVYPIIDLFLVQWESLLKKYRKAKYWGKVI